jgi:hypothetical protein
MIKKLLVIAIFTLFLQSCESLKEGLGLKKKLPDEFLIRKIDPIQKPPSDILLIPGLKKTNPSKKNNVETLINKNLNKNIQNTKSNDRKIGNTENFNLEKEILKKINEK